MKSCIISLALLLHITATAQLHTDCITAIEICSTETLTFASFEDFGVLEELGPPCVDDELSLVEFGSTWFNFSFVSDGVFYFTVTPDQNDRDIDFVVFQSSNNNCNSKIPVRCMAAGETLGDPVDYICLGPTGLSPESQDLFETYGCPSNNDNFLAALDVQSGDSYFLVVIDFTGGPKDSLYYTIEFFSTATFECAPVSVENNSAVMEEVAVFPNPISERFEIEIDGKSNLDYSIQVNDVKGSLMYSGKMQSGEKQTIDSQHWTSGIYYLRMINSQQTKTITLAKI